MKLSIIVPVYKVRRYLQRCIESILQQTYTDYELILVDDGSPDNCGAICDRYAQECDKVRVIHKKNGGLSSARNAGIAAARGEYITFAVQPTVHRASYLPKYSSTVRRYRLHPYHRDVYSN